MALLCLCTATLWGTNYTYVCENEASHQMFSVIHDISIYARRFPVLYRVCKVFRLVYERMLERVKLGASCTVRVRGLYSIRTCRSD